MVSSKTVPDDGLPEKPVPLSYQNRRPIDQNQHKQSTADGFDHLLFSLHPEKEYDHTEKKHC